MQITPPKRPPHTCPSTTDHLLDVSPSAKAAAAAKVVELQPREAEADFAALVAGAFLHRVLPRAEWQPLLDRMW